MSIRVQKKKIERIRGMGRYRKGEIDSRCLPPSLQNTLICWFEGGCFQPLHSTLPSATAHGSINWATSFVAISMCDHEARYAGLIIAALVFSLFLCR